MKQALVQKGNIILEEVPPPAITDNEVLIRTKYSVISTGTELAGISMSKESLLTRAMKQPHNLKKAMKMAADKGIFRTYKIIQGMLDFGTPIGYSLSGEVIEVGKNILDLKKGDLVTASGAGNANHAEIVAVPRTLVTKIPQGLDLKQAASVTLGAIALQGVRQANPKLGESVVVIGLGLLGQLTCQLLKNSGCKVVGIDIDEKRCEIAKKLGADMCLNPTESRQIEFFTDGFGADATIITASTESNEPLKQAMEITRKKGTVVVVGAIGLNLDRSPWYEKEIDLKISCSYGPGRYDPTYEEEMLDYPLPFVRWTENRNMDEYVKLLAQNKVNFLGLEPKEFYFSDAAKAYEELKEKKPLAMLLCYGEKNPKIAANARVDDKKVYVTPKKLEKKGKIGLALIGCGSFATTTHLPNIEKLNKIFQLRAIASKKGTTAKQYAKRYGAEYCTTDHTEVFKDPNIDCVIIATRHDLHAKLVIGALNAGKAVLVEKPLALNKEELDEIKEVLSRNHPPILTVGFNRRYSPFAKRIKELTRKRVNPLHVQYRMNAGYLPLTNWTQQPAEGGRIIGEACHIFDLFQFWTGAIPVKMEAASLDPKTKNLLSQDNFSVTIKYADGSVCTLLYTSQGPKSMSKEYCEVYCDGKAYILDDYRKLTVKGGGGSMKIYGQDKGHFEELETFANAVQKGYFPIPPHELFSTTQLSFEVNDRVIHE